MSLQGKLKEGPLDIVGDVHGDIESVNRLVKHLGYDNEGKHPENRSLVFVGDLVDRGPDSPAVVDLVKRFVTNGDAQCVLGNHELNVMLGKRKFDNGWFFGEEFTDPNTGKIVPQVLADDQIRTHIVDFCSTLPLVLQRDDLRVVHACWQAEMTSMVAGAQDVVEYYTQHRFNINLGLALRADLQDWQREQRHQNLNPVKVITSGLEVKADKPLDSSGKSRKLKRYPWWKDYNDDQLCIFGHYSMPYSVRRNGLAKTICVDYGIGRRWVPKEPGDNDPMKWRLAAIRHPELEIVFDNGDRELLKVAD